MHWRRPEIRERWLARRRRLVAAVAEILRQGVRDGKVRRDVRPDVLAAFLLGMLRARARDMTDVPERERSLKRVVDLFLAGAGRCG